MEKRKKTKIYDSYDARELSLERLISLYRQLNAIRLVYKELAPNDNSKNQPYLAGHFTDLGFLPTGDLIPSLSSSQKTNNPKRKIKFTAPLKFSWLSPEGKQYRAPNAKLIYYPQFPEVRLSGFVYGCQFDMGGWMDPKKKGRDIGRVLFFGIKNNGQIIAFLATPASRISKEIHSVKSFALSSVLKELDIKDEQRRKLAAGDERGEYLTGDLFGVAGSNIVSEARAKSILISEFSRIHQIGSIAGKRLNKHRESIPYRARNGGGYTLEAELGIVPNGIAEPDFLGWEVKQFGVTRFELINSKILTVMTPEPNGGDYVDRGVDFFIRNYGYQNPNIIDRFDFTGRHFLDQACEKSNLTLFIEGYNADEKTLEDANGFIGLKNGEETIAAKWSFAKLLDHWKKKHAKAVYIPSVASENAEGVRSYHYGNVVRLFEGTNLTKLLNAFALGAAYYDPGIKLENASFQSKIKRRSQFRIKSSQLPLLYDRLEVVDVLAASE